ncbi:hypothetical protein KI387_015501, partial [Taxus chinensis]
KLQPSHIKTRVQRRRAAEMTEFKMDDTSGTTLHLFLFSDVKNSKELLNYMQAGTLEPELAFFNALLIPDVFPVLAAAHKTLLAKCRGCLTTRTLHSELVYNCSGSKHITESLKRCGINENTTYILVARFDATSNELEATRRLVDGTEISLSDLAIRADNALIQKHYKISSIELGISTLVDAIVCRIAVRDAL